MLAFPRRISGCSFPDSPIPRERGVDRHAACKAQDALATRAAKKLRNEEWLLVEVAGTRLRHELDRIPLWRGDHVSVKLLAENMAKYLYLPRFSKDEVLLAAIREGLKAQTWRTETFAYADSWDESRKKYIGLRHGQAALVLLDGQSVLVKPEVADKQMQADAAAQMGDPTGAVSGGKDGGNGGGKSTKKEGGTSDPKKVKTPETPQFRRFHGSVRLDPLRLGRDAGQIAEEVVQHLAKIVGAEVEITLDISATLPEAASEKLVRNVTKNCRTLRFDNYDFEET